MQIAGVRLVIGFDVAGGTADLSPLCTKSGAPVRSGSDINHAMLSLGRDRVVDRGFLPPVAQCDAELPFPDNHFDVGDSRLRSAQYDPSDVAIAENAPCSNPADVCWFLNFQGVETLARPTTSTLSVAPMMVRR